VRTDILTAVEWETIPPADRLAYLKHMEWIDRAKKHQIPPPLELDYTIWALIAGRGSGKSRAGAETLWWWTWTNPNCRSLVLAPTANDIKFTCFEGVSGLLSVIPPELIKQYNKQDHEIHFINGSSIRGISADSYERLRGPQFHYAWVDELAAFQYLGAGEAWDMMMLGLRLGDKPRVIVTTTPKHKDLILDLMAREGDDVIIDRASTYDNIDNLSSTFSKQLEQYRGSDLYKQEVLGEVVDLEDGKVVTREMFKLWPHDKPLPELEYVLISLDTAYTDKEYNDPTACTVWGVWKPDDGPRAVLLMECWTEHLTFPKLKPRIRAEWEVSYGDDKKQKRPDLILIESKASGLSLMQELQAMHLPVMGWNPGRADKMSRLQIAASIFTSGRVWLPESGNRKGYVKDWCEGFISQLCAFPDATHDDYVDSATQAIRYLKDTGWLDINPEPTYDDGDYVDETAKSLGNPYAQ
jgi:predicted phage terminase large subunit-like protein